MARRRISPLIARRSSLAEARQAQELLAKGGVAGKVVLVLDGGRQTWAQARPVGVRQGPPPLGPEDPGTT